MTAQDWIQLLSILLPVVIVPTLGWITARLHLPASWMKWLGKIDEAEIECWIAEADKIESMTTNDQKRAWVAAQIVIAVKHRFGLAIPQHMADGLVAYVWGKWFSQSK